MPLDILYSLFGSPAPVTALEQMVMQAAMQMDNDRLQRMARALRAYYGDMPDPLTTEPGEDRDLVKVNFIAPMVNTGINYLFGNPPELEVPSEIDGEESKKESPIEQWIAECLRLNAWQVFLLDCGINGATCGTPFYEFDTTDPYPNADDPTHPYPRFHTISPLDMTIRCEPRDITRVKQYVWMHNTYDPDTARPVMLRTLYTKDDSGKFWEIKEQRAFLSPGVSQSAQIPATAWQDIATTIWPKPWCPIDHCKNLPAPNQVYGQPDITDTLIDANHAINFNLSNRMRIDKHHSHPKIFIVGYNGDLAELDTAVGTILNIPDTGEKVQIGQLVPAVDGSASATLKQEIYEAMLEETGTPSITMGSIARGDVPSGVALKIRLQPMLQKTETKQKLYGPWIVELIRRACELGGWGSDVNVNLTWPPLVPADDLETRNSLALDMKAGVLSKETYASTVGYDWEMEQARMEQERKAALKDAQDNMQAMGGMMGGQQQQPGMNTSQGIGQGAAPGNPAPSQSQGQNQMQGGSK